MTKKLVGFVLFIALCSSLLVTSAFAANIQDTPFDVEAGANFYEAHYTQFRHKDNYTSCYVKNTNTEGVVSVWVQRDNTEHPKESAYGRYDPAVTIDRHYGPLKQVENFNSVHWIASKNIVKINPGAYAYLTNFVKEDGYEFASIVMFPETNWIDYSILWSPDSV